MGDRKLRKVYVYQNEKAGEGYEDGGNGVEEGGLTTISRQVTAPSESFSRTPKSFLHRSFHPIKPEREAPRLEASAPFQVTFETITQPSHAPLLLPSLPQSGSKQTIVARNFSREPVYQAADDLGVESKSNLKDSFSPTIGTV